MGSADWMVVSRVAPSPAPPMTRLPTSTRRSEARPLMGATTVVHSSSSERWVSCACAAAVAASAALASARSRSSSLSDSASSPDRPSARFRSARASANALCALAKRARASASAALNGRASMRNKGSPCLTKSPSLNRRATIWPEMRGLTITDWLATNLPT